MLEKKVENQIKDYLYSKGAYYFKVHGSSMMPKGIPDLIVCYKGLFIGIEVKAPDKLHNTSMYQEIHRDNILKAGGIHIVANSLDLVKEVIEKL